MTSETKNRIAAIDNGIIPEGYKKTKVGIVPVEWEEKIGIELFEYIRNGFVGTVSPFYVEKGHKYIQGNNIKDGKIVSDNLMYVNDEFYNSHKNSILKKGDIIIIQSGDVGKCALVTDEYENANCHALIIMTPYPETNTFFISYLLNSSVGFDMIKGFVTGNVLHHILASDYKELKYVIPPFPEQQKIAEILRAQDKLIELQERKINQLKTLKKAYLQKMFPKKGCKYPELRFKGFTDAWEQREFKSVFTMLQNNTLSRAELVTDNGAAMNVHYGDILVKFGEVLDLEIEALPYIESENVVSKFKSSYLQNGDVIVADTAEDEAVGKCTEIANLSDVAVISGLHTIPLRPQQKFASGYLGYYLNSNSYHDTLIPLMQGTKVTSISKSALQGTSICYPTSYEEQQQIGTYFRNLDYLITLHQRKLDEEKQNKKALMQLLLTGKVRVKL